MLTTSGWMAATTLPSTLSLLARMTSGEWIPAVLRAEQRSKKVRDPQTGKVTTNRFVVPVLDLPGATIRQLVEGAGLVDSPVPLDAVVPAAAGEGAGPRRADHGHRIRCSRGRSRGRAAVRAHARPGGRCPGRWGG